MSHTTLKQNQVLRLNSGAISALGYRHSNPLDNRISLDILLILGLLVTSATATQY